MKFSLFCIPLVLCLSAADSPAAAGEPQRGQKPTLRSIEPVNVEVPFAVITGTVTVRAAGVLVDPQQISYSFQPEFKYSGGYLSRAGEGVYVMKGVQVPANQSYVLTIRAAYNDTVVRDGIVQKMGKTRVGLIRLDIPYGRDHSFGEQLLDLN